MVKPEDYDPDADLFVIDGDAALEEAARLAASVLHTTGRDAVAEIARICIEVSPKYSLEIARLAKVICEEYVTHRTEPDSFMRRHITNNLGRFNGAAKVIAERYRLPSLD